MAGKRGGRKQTNKNRGEKIPNNQAGKKRKPTKNRNGAGCSGGRGVPSAYTSSKNRVSNGPSKQIGNGGRIRLQRDELMLQVVTTDKQAESLFSQSLAPSANFMPFLFRLSSCYQRIRWLRMHIYWRPACGTNTNGIITYGVAYNNSNKFSARSDVTSLTPVCDHPVWQASGTQPLIIPGEMLMSRKWYALNTTGADPFDKQVGTFVCGLSHDAHAGAQSRGEFWASYTVEMEGTNPG